MQVKCPDVYIFFNVRKFNTRQAIHPASCEGWSWSLISLTSEPRVAWAPRSYYPWFIHPFGWAIPMHRPLLPWLHAAWGEDCSRPGSAHPHLGTCAGTLSHPHGCWYQSPLAEACSGSRPASLVPLSNPSQGLPWKKKEGSGLFLLNSHRDFRVHLHVCTHTNKINLEKLARQQTLVISLIWLKHQIFLLIWLNSFYFKMCLLLNKEFQ